MVLDGLLWNFVNRLEFDKARWSCPWNSDQNYTQNSARVTVCLKWGLFQLFSVRSLLNLQEKVVYYLLCMSLRLFGVSVVNCPKILGQAEVSDYRGL